MRKTISLLLVLILTVTVAAVGCRAGNTLNESETAKERIVKAALGFEDVDTLDPHYATIAPSMTITFPMFNRLVRFPVGTIDVENIEGDLAESWDISEDKHTITFHLRQGVQWQKGFGEVTSEDVKFSLERIMNDPTASYHYYLKKIAKIETLDKHTVEVKFSKPDPFFLEVLCSVNASMVPKAAVEKYEKDFRINPVGSGPYQLESYIPKEKVVVAANEAYFRKKPAVQKIEFLFIIDKNAVLNAFLSGTIDVADWKGEQKQLYEAVNQSKAKIIIDAFQGANFFIFLDTVNSPTKDIRVRKALAHAIDAETFVRMMEPIPGVWQVPSFGTLLPQNMGYTAEGVARYEYDPQKAKQLLAEAGYPEGFTIKGYCPQIPTYRVPITYVQDQLAKIGVKYDLQIVDYPTFNEKLLKGECRPLSWDVNYFSKDPFNRFSYFYTTQRQGFKYSGYDKVNQLVRSIENEFDPEKRKQVYQEIQRTVSHDVVAIPIQSAKPIMARWWYIDLGYQPKENKVFYYEFDENLQVMKH